LKNCVFDWRCTSFTGTKFGGENPQSESRPHSSPDLSSARTKCKIKSAEAKRKILSPRKTDFRFADEVITSLCFGNRCELGTIETQIQNDWIRSDMDSCEQGVLGLSG